ncbi:hypothetical protein RRG08_004758 [Elysia crispata]|uniref:Uncharacterized protein n=1 Tax=Elysia crispata TaxID=231223 RepID=A0AAE1AIV3_9GAST|nr:hypothetical protein RRG08_004758 [Elysia crispata]
MDGYTSKYKMTTWSGPWGSRHGLSGHTPISKLECRSGSPPPLGAIDGVTWGRQKPSSDWLLHHLGTFSASQESRALKFSYVIKSLLLNAFDCLECPLFYTSFISVQSSRHPEMEGPI